MDPVSHALADLGVEHRRVADGEWGLRVEAGGWPLDIGLSVRGGLLRVQAEVCGPGQVDPLRLLHLNRRTPLVAFTATAAGAIWIEAWLPEVAVDGALLDRVLGLLVSTATDVREGLRS